MVLSGSILALFGFGFAVLFLVSIFVDPARFFPSLLGAGGVSFIGLFGLNWVIQGVGGCGRWLSP